MSSTSCLAPPPLRLPCRRVRLPPPSAAVGATVAAQRPSLRFKPCGAAPTKGWRLVHISCFRQEQDVSTSDDGINFEYNEQAEISEDSDLKEEDGGSPNRDDQNYVNGYWFDRAQKILNGRQGTLDWTNNCPGHVFVDCDILACGFLDSAILGSCCWL
ncbi:hypothetical protein ZWY2020_002977 [Hordeum vulgare]|nr:hypothetical protein ZWY2020_002977 [Hordeum vulgare]